MTEMTGGRGLRLRYIVTICVGSFLLFLVQPMIARMALPRLGGAPAVWNSAMLVYQALLLAGYGYAHWLGRFAPRRQAVIHLGLFAAAAVMLPIGLVAATPSAEVNPFLWVPWLFIASIGPLFLMVSAQAPLMQRWFALSGGGDPYPLYAASNLGSFAGLIAYPLVVEPLLPLQGQSWLWTGGYAILVALIALCALTLPGHSVAGPEKAVAGSSSWRDVVIWTLLAAVPSGLMLSTSTHLSTDIIAMPLLWVLPLGLYLLSFTVAFSTKRRLSKAITSITPLLLIVGAAVSFANSAKFPMIFAPFGLLLLFAVSVALHARLYDRRPHPSRLTGFYLAMSAGGVVGGLFCALIAPLVFDWVYEHPVLILLAAFVLGAKPLLQSGRRLWQGNRQWVPATLISVLAICAFAATRIDNAPNILTTAALALIALGVVAIGQRAVFTLCLAALMLGLGGYTAIKESLTTDNRVRSFFGVYSVGVQDGNRRYLVHGTTTHGLQNLTPGHEREPLTYYAARSGVGLTMTALPQLFGRQARVGVVGVGAGTVACYARPGQGWRFYEIDPAIAGIARDARKFSFLSRCLPDVPIAIGDARIVLAREPATHFDLLVIDAFSSDAVPMHLMTREALDVYRLRLAPGGLLLMHISNRFLDLEPVLAAASADGWHSALREYRVDRGEAARGLATSVWVALANDRSTIDRLQAVTGRDNWRDLRARKRFGGWTDDHASILPLLKIFETK